MICVCGTKLCKLKMVSDILDHPVCRIKLMHCMLVDIGRKLYAVPSHPSDLEVKDMGQFE